MSNKYNHFESIISACDKSWTENCNKQKFAPCVVTKGSRDTRLS